MPDYTDPFDFDHGRLFGPDAELSFRWTAESGCPQMSHACGECTWSMAIAGRDVASTFSAVEDLLLLQHFVDYDFATLVGGNDLMERGISAERDVDLVVAGIEQDIDW